MRSNFTLGDVYGEGQTFFPKYPEPGKDCCHGDKFDFYAGDYGPDIIHTEEGRILPIIGDGINVLVGEGITSDAMVQYYIDTYPETFNPDSITPYKDSSYYDIISRVKQQTLITLHPYPSIDESTYYIDPNITFFLNNKQNLSKLTNNTPRREILPLEEIREIDNFPVVLKSFTGASGDGVRIIKNRNELLEALEYFKCEEKLIVEEYVFDIDNLGVQLLISADGTVEILGISRQIVSEKGEYEGSILNKHDIIDPELEKIALEVGNNAFKMGFNGICGLDFLKDKTGKYFLIDPNFRATGATSGIFLREKVFAESDNDVIQVQKFKSHHPSIKDMIKDNGKLGKEGLYILSSYRDQVSGIISGFCITTGESREHIAYKQQNVHSRKGFTL